MGRSLLVAHLLCVSLGGGLGEKTWSFPCVSRMASDIWYYCSCTHSCGVQGRAQPPCFLAAHPCNSHGVHTSLSHRAEVSLLVCSLSLLGHPCLSSGAQEVLRESKWASFPSWPALPIQMPMSPGTLPSPMLEEHKGILPCIPREWMKSLNPFLRDSVLCLSLTLSLWPGDRT